MIELKFIEDIRECGKKEESSKHRDQSIILVDIVKFRIEQTQ